MSLITFSYLRNHGKEYIGNQRNIIIVTPTLIMLPKKQLNGTQITMYNETNQRIAIDSNSNDLIYSQLYAPNGKKQIIIEPNRKFILTYLNYDINKLGKWYLDIF